jgi:alpha-ketoglutarate-dependent taurine dioxygenase
MLQCSRGSFTNFGAVPRSPNIPSITEAQAEALDALHFLADRFQFRFRLKTGDIQYVNDYCILHARSAFSDSAEHK